MTLHIVPPPILLSWYSMPRVRCRETQGSQESIEEEKGGREDVFYTKSEKKNIKYKI